jgi:cyclophilin family peptidyl-prolyl cis-trans isomerase
MKRFIKFICTALVAILSSAICLSLVACEDITSLSVTVSIYDKDASKNVEQTIEIDLYRHLAPDTVDAILSYVEQGYYNDLLFYKNADSEAYTSQVMVGDYAFVNGAINAYTQDYVSPIDGEFEKAGVTGSNLLNIKGAVGLWRDWNKGDTYKQNSSNSYNSGKATWYMPTTNLTGYDGYFCMFGQIDLDDEDTATALSDLIALFSDSELYTSYTVYYLGDDVEDLTLVIETTEDYQEKIDNKTLEEADIFSPEDDQLNSYAKREIYMPIATINDVENVITAKILSVEVD